MGAKKLFEGRTPEEILNILESNYEVMEEVGVSYPLTEEDIDSLNKTIGELSAFVHAKEREKKKYVKAINKEMKPQKEELNHKSLLLHSGQKEIKTKIYGIQDFDSGLMIFYLPDGTEYSSRRLRPEERQMRIT